MLDTLDINECTLNIDNCNANAVCADTEGSFTCTCNPGYQGDGVTCTSEFLYYQLHLACGLTCSTLIIGTQICGVSDNCDVNAICTEIGNSFQCECNSGYTGSGVACFGRQ